MASKKEYDLLEAIEAVGAEISPQVDIVAVKVVGPSKAPVVRVYIDHPQGVGFDILCDTQKWIGDILDEINPFSGSYTLEVSSPGPNRPLRKPAHFEKAVGEMVKIRTKTAVENRSAFTGTIVNANKEMVVIALDEGKKGEEPQVEIPFQSISDANVK